MSSEKSKIRFISKKELEKRRGDVCLLRVDLNVGQSQEFDSFRTKSSLKTLNFLKDFFGGKVIIMSHRGRFEGGGSNKPYSMKPFREVFENYLDEDVLFLPGFDFKKNRKIIKKSSNKFFVLENLRRNKGEQNESKEFGRKLASLGDFFIQDAFGVMHRRNSSVSILPRFIPSFGGLLLQYELNNLNEVLQGLESPTSFVLGGAKVKTKLDVIGSLWDKIDNFLVGGVVANTFLAAKGEDIGNSRVEKDKLEECRKYLKGDKVFTPSNFRYEKDMIMDLGKETVDFFEEKIKSSKSVIWNGPLGYFEKEPYAKASKRLARALVNSKAKTFIGGGETTTLVSNMGLVDEFDFVSTGGGAMLKFLSGDNLAGIKALESTVTNY
ncbi:MAG: phosphoglycerate kinase [Candidatus Magasanikbacteria bacterium]